MIEMKLSEVEPLQLDKVVDLLRSSGPCLTLMLPSYRPGDQAKSMAALLKTGLQDAARQLAAHQVPESEALDLLAPLQQPTLEEELQGGNHWGRAIFRAPGVLRQFELIEPPSPSLAVGGRFEIRPMLAQLNMPRVFYILELSKTGVKLLRCPRLRAERVALPKGVPETLDEAMAFEPPDHDLENRSAAGSSTGSMRAVRFGTGSGRETQRTHLADFYKAVDRGVRELLADSAAPLVLAGTDENIAAYRLINRYAHLLDQVIHGSPAGPAPEEELLPRAHAIVRSACVEQAAAALTESHERVSPTRFSTDLNAILGAAAEGRVSRLYVDEKARKPGVYEGMKRGGRWNWGEEDLLNLAAVETVLQGGQAFALPAAKMPDAAIVAGVFRY